MNRKTALIIGAGPGGLTAAYELLKNTDIKPVIFEATSSIGGLSRTINYHGNKIDIGGHRFFSKSDRIMEWWQQMMPIQEKPAVDDLMLHRDVPFSARNRGADPEKQDQVLLIRKRFSRIYFNRKFIDYPLSLNGATIKSLGLAKISQILWSYALINVKPIKNEISLEDFFINRFGRELYRLLLKDYTEKVWGVPCHSLPSEWGVQRVRELSVFATIRNAVFSNSIKNVAVDQKNTETSLISHFLYPKYGPGQFWETVAKRIIDMGGEIHMGHNAFSVGLENDRVCSLRVRHSSSGREQVFQGDYLFSTMPLKHLIRALPQNYVPTEIRKISEGLVYRDFIIVGILVKQLEVKNGTTTKTINNLIRDNWMYIQSGDVKVGRLQIFNNWSPYMVADSDTVWLGAEYFCNENDRLWSMEDKDLIAFAINELEQIEILERDAVIDSTINRIPKAYPAYLGTYEQFDDLKSFTGTIDNLFLIGRNGMHRYNNMDHSMLTAVTAVENIKKNRKNNDNIWSINTEQDYHETRES